MPVMKNPYLDRDPEEYRILTKFEGVEDSRSLKTYREHAHRKCAHEKMSFRGYEALKKVLAEKAFTPDEIIAMVKDAGLRGRGGAGFPAGLKWGFIPKGDGEKYLVVNFDEGEPGTYKDRYLAEISPHMLIEGMVIAAYAIGAQKSYIYIRGEFYEEREWLETAMQEAYDAGYIGKDILGSGFTHQMDIYGGSGAYICGEETGLISSLEGKKGQPKIKPPFPAVSGYLKKPTLVNNVETIAAVPWIVLNGADAYKTFGTERAPGTKLFNISGATNAPGCYELPLGYPLKRFIEEDCGGLPGGQKLKAVIPGGASAPVLTPEEVEKATLDYECFQGMGTMLGSGAVIVIPEDFSMVDALDNLLHFFANESCGQCTPCREGTGWISRTMHRIVAGKASKEDIYKVKEVANNMQGKTICVLSMAAAGPAISFVDKFSSEFHAHLDSFGGNA